MEKDDYSRLFCNLQFKGPEGALGFWLWRAAHQYQRMVDRIMEPLGLTHLQFVILTCVAWCHAHGYDEVTQGDIYKRSSIHIAQISSVVKALVAKGYLTQERGHDGRYRLLNLTDAGGARLQEALPLMERTQRQLFSTDGEFEALREHLRRLLDQWN